jgi:hypothetical protein
MMTPQTCGFSSKICWNPNELVLQREMRHWRAALQHETCATNCATRLAGACGLDFALAIRTHRAANGFERQSTQRRQERRDSITTPILDFAKKGI